MKKWLFILFISFFLSGCSGGISLDGHLNDIGGCCGSGDISYYCVDSFVLLNMDSCLEDPIDIEIDMTEALRLGQLFDASEEDCIPVTVESHPDQIIYEGFLDGTLTKWDVIYFLECED